MTGTNPRRQAPPQAIELGLYGQSPLHWSRPPSSTWMKRNAEPALFFVWFAVVPFLSGVFLQWLFGSENDWLLVLPSAASVVGIMAWCAWVDNKPAGVKKMIARSTLLGLAAAMTIAGASYGLAKMMSTRYESRRDGAWLYVVDRLTGAVKSCNHRRGCMTLTNDAAPKTVAAEQPAPIFDTSRLRPIGPADAEPGAEPSPPQ